MDIIHAILIPLQILLGSIHNAKCKREQFGRNESGLNPKILVFQFPTIL